MSSAPPLWFSTAGAAEQLGVSPGTIYRFINSGELVAYRVGRVLRIRGSDIDAFLERCRVTPEGRSAVAGM